jgi:hypothetical protein
MNIQSNVELRTMLHSTVVGRDTWLLFRLIERRPSRPNKKTGLLQSLPNGGPCADASAVGWRNTRFWISFLPRMLLFPALVISAWVALLFQQLASHVKTAGQSHITLLASYSPSRSLDLDSNPAPQILADAVSSQLVAGSAHVNLAQDSILITEDRTYRCLYEWKSRIEAKDRWIAPLCLSVSLILTFVTATFHDAFNIAKEAWQAVYIVGIVLSGIWTIREVGLALARLFSKEHPGSIEDLIVGMKKGAHVVRLGVADSTAVKREDPPMSIPSQ